MKESIKMEDLDGYLRMSQKINKTKILPLRWIGNLSGKIAGNSLVRAFDLQEDNNLGYRFKFHSKVWHYLNKLYTWWGTYYELDIKGMIKDLDGAGWDDYDEFGKAYWDKNE